MNIKKMSFFVKSMALLVATFVLCAIIAIPVFLISVEHPAQGSITITLNYDTSTEGLAPTGELYSVQSIKDNKIIDKALQELGLSEKYKSEDILKNLSVTGNYPKDIVKQLTSTSSISEYDAYGKVTSGRYFPTSYSVVLYNDFDHHINSASLKELVQKIAEIYCSEFMNKYSFSTLEAIKADDYLTDDSNDYFQDVSVMRLRIKGISDYAAEIYRAKPSFMYEGSTFNDIVKNCATITQYDLPRIESNITVNALSKDVERLCNDYEQRLLNLEYQLSEAEANLESINQIIDGYEKDAVLYIASGDSTIKIDSNSEATYNSLIATRVAQSQAISSIAADISYYEQRLNDYKNPSANSARNIAKLETDIDSVNKQIDSIENHLSVLVKAYNRVELGNCIYINEAKVTRASIFSGSYIVQVVKIAAPVCLVVLAAIHVLIVKKNIDKFKADSKADSKAK